MPSLHRGVAMAAATASLALAASLTGPAHASAGPHAGPTARPAPVESALGSDPAVQRRLDRLVEATGLPGALASVRGSDGVVRTYTAGTGDLETGEPVPADGRVRIASNTKTFVATVVLQLVGEGAIRLDAPVERYLPGVVRGHGHDGRRITVRQLLQQTSGLPDYDSILLERVGSLAALSHTYFEPHDLLEAALGQPREVAPGERWQYSNTNYVLLGLIVQRVTGRPIGVELDRRIIEPLDLGDTYWPHPGEQGIRGPHPRGYLAERRGAPWQDSTRIDPSMGWAAGQLVSTPADLGRFMQALLGGELLEPAQLAQMRRTVRAPRFDAAPGWRYGLGLARHELSCGGVGWGHGGDIQGFETRNLVTDDGRWAVVAVTGLPTSMAMVREVSATVDTLVCAA